MAPIIDSSWMGSGPKADWWLVGNGVMAYVIPKRHPHVSFVAPIESFEQISIVHIAWFSTCNQLERRFETST